MKSGVPQGSLLGPLLFNIYMNDLTYCISNTSVRFYADKTTVYGSDVSPMVLEYSLNSDLHLFSAWFNNNYLKVNTQKIQAMPVSWKRML